MIQPIIPREQLTCFDSPIVSPPRIHRANPTYFPNTYPSVPSFFCHSLPQHFSLPSTPYPLPLSLVYDSTPLGPESLMPLLRNLDCVAGTSYTRAQGSAIEPCCHCFPWDHPWKCYVFGKFAFLQFKLCVSSPHRVLEKCPRRLKSRVYPARGLRL